MLNNFIKSNQKAKGNKILLYNKVKNKSSFLKICVQIIEYINGGNYLVKIKGDYNIYNLNNNEIYCVKYNLLRKCDNQTWKNIFELNNKKYSNDNIEGYDINSLNSEEISNISNDSRSEINIEEKSELL